MLAKRIYANARAAVIAIATAVPSLLCDLAGLSGVGLCAYGAWLAYPPAGFLTGGVLLIAGAVLSARSK